MKSRLILSLVILATVFGTTAFGAFAYFNAQAGTGQIKITTGRASIALTDCADYSPDRGGTSLHGFDFPNGLVPGDEGKGCFRIWNTGQGNLALSFKTGDVKSHGAGLENAIQIAVGECRQDSVAQYAAEICPLNEDDPLKPGESQKVDYTYLFPTDAGSDQASLQDGTLTFNVYVDAETVPAR